jgi:hypothetical protein
MNVIIPARSLVESATFSPFGKTRGAPRASRLASPAHKIEPAPPAVTVHIHSVECACLVSRQHKDTMMQVLNDGQVAFEAALAQKKRSAIVGPRRRRG